MLNKLCHKLVVQSVLIRTNSWTFGHTFARDLHDLCRVVVTGIGIVCPLGVQRDQVWTHLTEGACGVSRVVGDGYDSIPCKIAAYVPNEEQILKERFTANELRTL